MYPNLRVQLWKSGMRQNRLARILRMHETLLSRIMNGYRQPSPEVRRKISVILHSDETWLFQEENANPENPVRLDTVAAPARACTGGDQ
jgi:transcriptional regulator with XRE-family HTH domain